MGKLRPWWTGGTESAQLNRILHRIAVSSAALVAVLALASLCFRLIGGAKSTWSDAIYMTLITISTVGYGEIIPLDTVASRLFAGSLSLLGFGIITFLFTSLTLFFLESDLDLTLRRRRMEKRINELCDHYIVCGFGRVGRNVAVELEHTHRAFVAIDNVPAQIEEGGKLFPNLVHLNGDGSDDNLLIAAGIANAAGVFAVTGDDSLNLMITITAKQLNPKARVVARCHELRNAEKVRKVGADEVVSPDFTGGKRIASLMLRPQVVSFLDEMLRSDEKLRVEEIGLSPTFKARALREMTLQDPEFILIAVRVGSEWIFNPQPDFILQPGHTLIAMATPYGRHLLGKQLESAAQHENIA